ncbi:hypothetical protein BHE74_00038524 [Ensete ventricosum]|nr:hypothetical protein GW17_00050913 [Ensete ventricosum]RWW54871.1 hypothetical protein BHE74_00038524 [Ensete ventricosum]RZS13277.1 hypothetical protein BHM03_00044846 [Ensete ventricosum]
MRWCYAPLVVASASGRVMLPSGGNPYRLAAPPRTATWSVGPPMVVVPTSNRRCRWASCCKSLLLQAPCCRRPPLRVARLWLVAPAVGLVMADHPCRGLGHGRPPFFPIAFVVKT